MAALAAGNTALALTLYRELGAQDPTGNVFSSPYSISNALALAYVGARGETAQQMAGALHFTLALPALNAAFAALDLTLASRNGDAIRLDVVDGFWGDQSVAFDPSYLATLSTSYGSPLQVTNFAGAPDDALQAINRWVADATRGLMRPLLPGGAVTRDTRAVLVNALYLDAKWATPFDASYTHKAPFTRADGSVIPVDTMTKGMAVRRASGAGWEAVELPYRGGQLSMVILLPAPGQLASVEGSLTGDFLASVVASLSDDAVTLSMPKLDLAGSTFSLKSELSQLGMVDAFRVESADFSGMAADPLHLDDVFHKATIIVDEDGTVAAAATAAVFAGLSGTLNPPPALNVDRPYLLLIRDRPTGTLLFVGRVLDPLQ